MIENRNLGDRESSAHILLALVIFVAIAISATWLVRVPFFQEPDESAHADYAFALFDAGRPFKISQAHPATNVTPELRYLEDAARFRALRYDSTARVPKGYGSLAYFGSLDRNAPRPTGAIPRRGSAVPYVMFGYSEPFYALVALIMTIAYHLSGGSLVGAFFGARLVGLICLVVTILATFGILRTLRASPGTALVATAATAFFPMLSWVSAYVQPDNLTTALFSLVILAALRWRVNPQSWGACLALGALLVLLAAVKQHYAAIAVASTTLLLLSFVLGRKLSVSKAIAFSFGTTVLPLIATVMASRLAPVSQLQKPVAMAWGAQKLAAASPLERVTLLLKTAFVGFVQTFVQGDAFAGFWGAFGWTGTKIFGIWQPEVQIVLGLISLNVIVLFAIRQMSVLRRLATAVRHHPRNVIELVLGDVALNAYFITTAFLIAVFAFSQGQLWLQGRYWMPLMSVTVALTVVYIPRLFAPRLRAGIARAAASGWLAYSLIATPASLQAMEGRFYRAPSEPPRSIEPYARLGGLVNGSLINPVSSMTVRRGQRLRLSGFAFVANTGLPADGVVVSVDGRKQIDAIYRLPESALAALFSDDALLHTGFATQVPTEQLAPGQHVVRVFERDRHYRDLRPTHILVNLNVTT